MQNRILHTADVRMQRTFKKCDAKFPDAVGLNRVHRETKKYHFEITVVDNETDVVEPLTNNSIIPRLPS